MSGSACCSVTVPLGLTTASAQQRSALVVGPEHPCQDVRDRPRRPAYFAPHMQMQPIGSLLTDLPVAVLAPRLGRLSDEVMRRLCGAIKLAAGWCQGSG
ncbi:toxin [Ornithinimicrobium tianjinense]|uniref:Uncharacterized protein n=1 Tax=Ornithinimicrobium tianjinense TaxID=1195761 RepID=A0A917F309_9MICO|nr:toxin [Ornithinimicrobium tianjinense]GGF39917.1 hypothetical protein GCM10011366_04410 [Ornithinimicrobium tianjinense]